MISIDPEFKEYMAACNKETDEELEASVLATKGPLDTIKIGVFDDEHIVVDGHRRLEICIKHKLPYDVEEIPFESRQDALRWMDEMQSSRRNLTPNQLSLVRARMVKSRGQGYGSITEVAEESNVSTRTVRRDLDFERDYGKIDPTLQERAQTEMDKVEVHGLAQLSPSEQKKLVKKADREGVKVKAALPPDTLSKSEKIEKVKRVTLAALGKVKDCIYDMHSVIPDNAFKSQGRALVKQLRELLDDWLPGNSPNKPF